MNWINVNEKLPVCSRKPDSLGVPVLIWPRNPGREQSGIDGHCYFGMRVTSQPSFYKFGAVVHGVTYWQPMPEGPT